MKPNFVVPYPSNHEGKVLGFACKCVKLSNLVVAQTVSFLVFVQAHRERVIERLSIAVSAFKREQRSQIITPSL